MMLKPLENKVVGDIGLEPTTSTMSTTANAVSPCSIVNGVRLQGSNSPICAQTCAVAYAHVALSRPNPSIQAGMGNY